MKKIFPILLTMIVIMTLSVLAAPGDVRVAPATSNVLVNGANFDVNIIGEPPLDSNSGVAGNQETFLTDITGTFNQNVIIIDSVSGWSANSDVQFDNNAGTFSIIDFSFNGGSLNSLTSSDEEIMATITFQIDATSASNSPVDLTNVLFGNVQAASINDGGVVVTVGGGCDNDNDCSGATPFCGVSGDNKVCVACNDAQFSVANRNTLCNTKVVGSTCSVTAPTVGQCVSGTAEVCTTANQGTTCTTTGLTVCNEEPDPNVCVQCIDDSTCGGTNPRCDLAAGSATINTCVASDLTCNGATNQRLALCNTDASECTSNGGFFTAGTTNTCLPCDASPVDNCGAGLVCNANTNRCEARSGDAGNLDILLSKIRAILTDANPSTAESCHNTNQYCFVNREGGIITGTVLTQPRLNLARFTAIAQALRTYFTEPTVTCARTTTQTLAACITTPAQCETNGGVYTAGSGATSATCVPCSGTVTCAASLTCTTGRCA
jgi:hypothetical protein